MRYGAFRVVGLLVALPLVGCSDTDFIKPYLTSVDATVDANDASNPGGDGSADVSDGTVLGDGTTTSDVLPATETGDSSRGETSDGAEETSSDALADGDGNADAAEAKPACDPTETPDRTSAVFVSALALGDGGAGAGDGSPERPYGTLAQGLLAAKTSRTKTIFLDQATYAESVALSIDVTLRGGFKNTAGSWRRDCAPNARARTIIASPTNVGVRVTGGASALDTLTVTTADGKTLASGEGESTFGVWVSGDGTSLQLTNVAIEAGKGGPGTAASGTVAAPPNTCTATVVCDNGAVGAEGAPGKNGEPGSFSEAGYSAVPALPGAVGAPGKNGTPGEAGAAVNCVQCEKVPIGESCYCNKTTVVRTGASGTCGCGGTGGAAGHEGKPGGASVSVFVGTKGTLNLSGSKLSTDAGGDGSAGLPGLGGDVGADGAAGAPAQCGAGTCVFTTLVCSTATCAAELNQPIVGGAKGSKGGTGGKGGAGGGGAGGPSYALVTLGKPAVTLDENTELVPGTGGKTGGTTTTAPAAPRLDQD